MRLQNHPTDAPDDLDKEDAREETAALAAHIGERQAILWAEGQRAVLVVLQGMDASGKDSVARNVFGGCNPVGVRAVSFKSPTDVEKAHDFLWRVHPHAPAKGEIGLFIRSHYEDVLIHKVHGWADAERLRVRYDAINAFERLLRDDGATTVLKFCLHTSKKDQKKELLERLEDETKQWKHNPGDWDERERWDDYMEAYNDAITICSDIPWIVVPSDRGWYRNLVVARAVAAALDALPLAYPALPDGEAAAFIKAHA